MVILTVFRGDFLTVNGERVRVGALNRFLERVYETRARRLLFVSIEGGEYQETVSVLDRLRSLRANIILLTPKSREELERDLMPESNCWLHFSRREDLLIR